MSIKLRALSLSLMLAVSLPQSVFAAQTEQSSEMLMRGAKKWIAKDRPDLAKSMLKKLILIEPTSEEALFMLGSIELKMGKPEEALRHLNVLERSAPNSARTRELAEAYRQSKADKAVQDKPGTLALGGKREEAGKVRGEVSRSASPKGERVLAEKPLPSASKLDATESGKIAKGKTTEALQPHKSAGKPKAKETPVETEGGESEENPDIVARTEALDALQDGKLEEAENALQSLLARRPQDPEVLGGLGLVKLRQGKNAEAAARFQQALQAAQAAKGETARWESLIETANFWSGLRSAEALLEDKRLAEAEETILQALALKPGNPNGLAVLGKIQAAAGNDAGAESSYREALKAEGYNVSSLVGLVDLLSRTDRKEEALSLLEQVIQDYPLEWKKNPDSLARLWREEANLYAAMNRPEQAVQALEQGVIADPRNPWGRYFLAKQYIGLNMIPRGLRVVQEGVALAPENAEMRYVQALVLLSVDDFAGALGTLNRIPEGDLTEAMRHARSRALVQYSVRKAETLIAHGDRKEAIRIMSVAEAQSAGSYPAMEQIAEGWFRLGMQAQGLRVMRKLPQPMPLETQVHYAALLNRAKQDQELVGFLPTLEIPQGETEENRRYREAIRDIEFDMAGRQFDKLLDAGKTEEAQQLADSVLEANHLSTAEYFRAWSNYFNKAKLPADVIPSLLAEKEQAPDDRDLRWTLAYAYHQEKQNDKAKQELRELLSMTPPDDIDGRIRIAKLQQSIGDVAGARRIVNDLAERHPGDVDVLFQAGGLAQGGGRYNEAMDYYEKTRKASLQKTAATKLPSGKTSAGQASLELPNTTESQRIYRTALASDAAQPRQAVAGSTVLSQAELEMARIEARRTAKIETGLDVQTKKAADGTSTYNVTEVPVLVSFPIGYEAQGMIQVDKVNIDAGALPSTLADASLFGTIKANRVIPPQPLTPPSSGTSIGFGYAQGAVRADIGKTGIGFPVSNVVGGIRTGGKIGKADYSLNLSRRPYTGSQLSYAGMRDPVTGATWGGITNTGLALWTGGDLGTLNASWGGEYGRLTGKNVQGNDRLLMYAVVDKDVYDSGSSVLNVGVNANFMRFARNQAHYTFGHGGYYSPQSSLSLGVPVELSGNDENLAYRIKASVSYSRTQDGQAPYYPNDPMLQALAGGATYPGSNGSGFGYGLLAAAEYRISPELMLGGRFSMDRSAYYAPNSFMLYLRYLFKPETGAVRKPEPIVPYSQY